MNLSSTATWVGTVPLADVLKYATERHAGLRYRVDRHVVVIYKPPPTAPNAKP